MDTRHPLAEQATRPVRRVLVLEAEGFEVVGTCSAEEALAELVRQPPHVALVDLARPDQAGWTFLERCRQQPGCAHVPIAVMSTTVAQATAAAAAREHGYGWLPKPFELDHLLALMHHSSRLDAPGAACSTEDLRPAVV